MTLERAAEELARIVADRRLLEEERLGERGRALESLDFVADKVRAYERSHGPDTQTGRLLRQAVALRDRLTRVNHELFEGYRDQIRAHTISPAALRRLFDLYTSYAPAHPAYRHLGFEALDRLVAGLLLRDRPPAPRPCDTPEIVTYQPTPASVVLELVDRLSLGPNETFCDIGAGLGLVVHLVGLLTGYRAFGIEVDPGLCAYAKTVARDLNIAGVSFINADARDANLGDATVYYLFTPFTGALFADVMARLADQATRRPIRVCGYGPITPYLARVPWLTSLNDHGEDEFRLALFESH